MLVGINLRETRGKQAKTKFSTSPPTVAKRSSRKLVKESTPQVRRRIPRQVSPLETVQVNNTLLSADIRRPIKLLFSNPTQVLIKRHQTKGYKEFNKC